jgi:hypothetical protein
MKYWAYRHINGGIHLKAYRDDLPNARASIEDAQPEQKCHECGCEFVKSEGDIFTINLDCECKCHEPKQIEPCHIPSI